MTRSIAGFEYRWREPERLITVADYRRVARRRVPRMVWTYVDHGADDMVSLRDNEEAFSRWSLRWRALTGHEHRDLSTTVAGEKVDLPVLLAPTGLTGLTYWKGDLAAARAAEALGSRYVLSTMSSWSIEEVADASRRSHFFQLYPRSGSIGAELMDRAWNAGMRVLMVTVDVPVRGNREGERRHGMAVPPVLTPGRMLDIATKPRWALDLLRHQRIAARNVASAGGLSQAVQSVDQQTRQMMQSTLDWDDLMWMRDRWKGPLYVKGILDAEDAKRAVAIGADGIVVSNHGGRQLDYAKAPLDALPEIVGEVGDRAEVLLDGGVRRGSDVIKAVALGAQAVLIGRPYLYGMAVEGERGVQKILEIFRDEIDRTLTLMGAQSVHELDRSWLIPR